MIEAPAEAARIRVPERRGFRRLLVQAENLLLSLTLAAIVLLPLLEILLRKLNRSGISGATAIVQHLVLVASMLGAAIAARERRLLSLGMLTMLLRGRWRAAAMVLSGGVAAAVAVVLGWGAFDFLRESRLAGKILAYGVPVWAVQAILPAGFAAIALRLIAGTSERAALRIATTLLAGLLVLAAATLAPEGLVLPAFGLLLLATLFGAPIFAALGGAAAILFWGDEISVSSISISHYEMVVNPSLATIPLFTLAGYFLAEGGASKRLVDVFQAFFGHVRGGPAVVTAIVCAFFTSFTGASGVTILALGGLLLPVLRSAGYSERTSLGLLTGAGSLGLLFPPCLPLILYAIVATSMGSSVTLREMFLGGVLPGTLLVLLTAWWGVARQPKGARDKAAFSGRAAMRAAWTAKWELLLPVVALGALFSGLATPVEAAAVTALYAFVVEAFLYRDLREVPRVMAECGLLVGGVLLILGVAMGLTNYLVDAQVPDRAVEWVQASIHSRWLFLLVLNLFLLVVGCLMDIFSAIVVVVPLIVPMAQSFGIHPVHLGIIFLANLELGYLTPPVGMNLFLSSYRFGKPMSEVIRASLPMLLVLAVGVLLITYWPALTTWLPSVLR